MWASTEAPIDRAQRLGTWRKSLIEKVYLPDYDPLKGGDPNAKPQ